MNISDHPETVEKVDNTNVIHRAMVANLVVDGNANVSTVMESLAAEGRICEADVDTAAAKGWLDAKQVEAIKSGLVKPAREAARDNADNV